MLKKTIFAGVILGFVAAAGIWGLEQWKARRNRDLDRRVESSVAALLGRESTEIVQETLTRLTQRPDRKTEMRLLVGGMRLRAGDPTAALQVLAPLSPEGPLRIPHLLLLGETLYQTGRLSEAEAAFRRVVAERPEEAESHRWLATIYHDLGMPNPAMTELEQLAKLRPDDHLAFRLMALIYAEDFRKYDLAIENYRRAIACQPAEPDRTDIQRELAQCLVLEKEFSQALEILKLMPAETLKQLLEIESLRGLGEAERAQEILDGLIQREPDHQGVLLLSAMLAIDRGDGQAALPALKELLTRNPHDYVARHQLTLAYQSLGDAVAAKVESERMLASKELHQRHDALYSQAVLAPDDSEVRLRLADVCVELGRSAEAARWRHAAEEIRRAQKMSPRQPVPQDSP